MKLCLMSKCVFDCPEKGATTNSLKRAIEWHMDGADVHFSFDGVYVGLLNFAGIVDKVDDLPDSDSVAYGTVFYCEETQSLHPNIPDELLESMPEA